MANDDDHDDMLGKVATSTFLYFQGFSQVNTYNYHQILSKEPQQSLHPPQRQGVRGQI